MLLCSIFDWWPSRELEGLFYFARGLDCQENGDTAPIEAFMQEACAAQCEGLMVKTLSVRATYEPSKRSTNWLKLKKDYIEGMGVCDSVDLVPLGGYIGRGKRCQVYGAFLMACYDPDTDEYQSVCKVGEKIWIFENSVVPAVAEHSVIPRLSTAIDPFAILWVLHSPMLFATL